MAKIPTEIKSLARSHTKSAITTLAAIMNKTDAQDSARVAAAKELLDRGWGRSVQFIEADVTRRYVARLPEKAGTVVEWQSQNSTLQ